jgi:LysM repeat protein
MSERPPSYVVESGDTLSAIAERFYGDADLAGYLAESNGIADMNSINVGQEINLPLTKEEFEAISAMMAAQSAQASEAQVAADAQAAADAKAAADAAAAQAAADAAAAQAAAEKAAAEKAAAEAAATKKALEYDVNEVVVHNSDGVNRGEYSVSDVTVRDSNG